MNGLLTKVARKYTRRSLADLLALHKPVLTQHDAMPSRLLRSYSSQTADEEPFYGYPREEEDTSWKRRLGLTLTNAVTALKDPTRADAVAAVGELTGTVALEGLLQAMKADREGRRILKERPIVSKENLPFERLLEQGARMQDTPESEVTFGQAYGAFLATHDFDPDERSPIQYIDDEELAYIMLRYRQCHDFWHALTGLPPTVPGELGLKWLELFSTGLPLAAFSCTAGSLTLSSEDRRLVYETYLPWALRCSRHMQTGSLLCVYYEKEFDTPLVELRERLGLTPAPTE